MSDDDYQAALAAKSLDRGLPASERIAALKTLMSLDPTRAKSSLLDLTADPSEDIDLLGLAGKWLADLAVAGVVSQWDLRDLADPAAEAFFESE